MEDIQNIQLPETAQNEDTRSESVDCEEDTSTIDNSDSILLLRNENPIVSISDKTDEEKLVQNTDNLLNVNINSPKTTLLGKLKAKQRLQAFLLPKQNLAANLPVKKLDEGFSKVDKGLKKPKKSPAEKAKSLIEELEEIKKVEIAHLLSPTLFKERKNSYREKHYRKKSRSRSLEFYRRIPEKGKYPDNWEEMKERELSLEEVREIKLSKNSKNIKHQDTCYDFRKQLLFESPAQTLVSLKAKGVNGQDKIIPPQYIRFTKKTPSVSFSVSHYKYYEEYLSTPEVYDYIPKPHVDIIKKLKRNACSESLDDSPKKSARKWYPKQPLSNITEGCELLEQSLGLSILQNYMNEEEDEEKYENDGDFLERDKDEFDVSTDKERFQIVKELSLVPQSTYNNNNDNFDIKDKFVEKEDMNKSQNENEKLQVEISPKVKKSKSKKKQKHKKKKDKKEKREMRKRKRKKQKHEMEDKKKKLKTSKNEKKIVNSEQKKESKSKRKESSKSDKKIDIEDKKKYKENNKKDKEVGKDDKKEDKIEHRKDDKKENQKEDKKKDKKESKKEDKKENRKEDKKGNKKEDKKYDRKEEKKIRDVKSKDSIVQLYYDEFESIRCRSLSKERIDIKKETPQKLTDDKSKESKTKDKKPKETLKGEHGKDKRPKMDVEFQKGDDEYKKEYKFKEENLFKIEPLKTEEDLRTPDTDEYHSHWESDEDVSNVISYSPLLPQKLDMSWESDEEIANPDKTILHNRYMEQSLKRNNDRPIERRSKKFLEQERSLEMPLNISNLSRKGDSRRLGKPLDFPERKFLNNEVRLLYNEDSWERGEYLKICNDIEGEKLRHEGKTLSEERRLLELEKRKLAEKLEKRSFNCDIFDDFKDSIVKEVTYEKIHAGNDDVYLKSTDYINEKRSKSRKDEHDIKKKIVHDNRKRIHSVEDHGKKYNEEQKEYKHIAKKKSKYEKDFDKLDSYDVKCENYKDDLVKLESNTGIYEKMDRENSFEIIATDHYKHNKYLGKKEERMNKHYVENKKCLKRKRSRWETSEKEEKYHRKIGIESEKNDSLLMSDISESLNSTCDSLVAVESKTISSKSDILENEYEEFLKAVTSDISNSDSLYKEKKLPVQKKQESKKSRAKRRRKYSSSSSSSSSDSYDSDSSTSSSSSSSYTSSSSSSSSSSSYEKKKKWKKMKAKQKEKENKDQVVKIEMTHSIVKDLDDLQPFPISKTPVIQIKKEQEDPGYSTIPTVVSSITEKDVVVPLPVPSPAIVPPPLLNLLSIKQEKPDESITIRADSTTSPVKKTLIPTKFIIPISKKEVSADVTSNSSITDTLKKQDSIPIKTTVKEAVESSLQPVKNSYHFSIPVKGSVVNENINDSDSQDFTDYFLKKSDKIGKDDQIEVKPGGKESKILLVSTKKEVEENEKTSTKNNESIITNAEPISPCSKESDSKKTDFKISNPVRESSPDKQRITSPERKLTSPKHQSPSRGKRISLSESSKESPRRSISPKYRNFSPRRDSSPRRRSRELSPVRRSSGYRDDSILRRISPRRRGSPNRNDRRRKSPSPRSRRCQSSRSRTSISPRNRKSISPKYRRSPSPRIRRSPSPRTRRSPSPRIRRSPSPRIRRSPSPRMRRSASPRNYRSSFRNHSPNRLSSPSEKDHRRSYSRSVSIERKKESIQQTLQRLAGVEDHYHQVTNKSPINSPVEGFKRSVADSTISDDQLLQQNFTESIESPAYRTPSARLVHSPASPKRVPLDIRINQVLGLDKQTPKPITTAYTQTTYTQSYTYEQYSDHYGHYPQYGQNVVQRESYDQPPPPLPKPQSHVGSSKVVQIGNVLQVVPTEEIPTQADIVKKPPSQKIVQVGNMLQIVPTPTPHMPKETMVPPPVSVSNAAQKDVSLVLQPPISLSQPPLAPLPVDHNTPTTSSAHEKISPEELMLQKIAEKRAERAKRHEEREKKRKEKEKRKKEKEKKKQMRLKMKTENMIKKALRIETEALAMGENIDDNEENAADVMPSCWPSISVISNPPLKPAGKSILITHGFSKIHIEDENEQKKIKTVKFADGVAPGEGTSPSGGEELSSPPPPKGKQFKKMKKKRLQKKKKIKVKIIRKSSTDSPDDEELDNLPPPSPPPGSPPPHIFPARIKTHTINNIHPTYATGVPLMTVGSYPPQFRPNIPITVPPPIHNLSHGPHLGQSATRAPPPIISQHGPSLHGPIPHGVPSGLTHGLLPHPHGPPHHSSGPRV